MRPTCDCAKRASTTRRRKSPPTATGNSTDRKSTRLNSSHLGISYAVFCLNKKSTRLNSSHLGISYAVFCLQKNSEDKLVGEITQVARRSSLIHLAQTGQVNVASAKTLKSDL